MNRENNMTIFTGLKIKVSIYIAITTICLSISHSSFAATLTSNQIVVNDSVVRLADIFAVDNFNANDELFQAPPLGRKGILSIKKLTNIANKYNIEWNNSQNFDKVTITRKAITIDADAVKTIIADYAIANQHIANKIDQIRVRFTTKFKNIIIAASDFPHFEIINFSYLPYSDQFSAEFKYKKNGRSVRHNFTGKLENFVSIPVLTHNMAREQIIKQSDIKYIQINNRKLVENIVQSNEDIIGKSVKNNIRAMQPINQNLLKLADLVKQNTIINLKFKMGRIHLTIKARALSTGAKGSIIRVMNLKSGKQVEAIVTGLDQAMTLNSTPENAEIAFNN